jgi:hypothetical protein
MAWSSSRSEKWSFLFWIGQFAAISGMVAFLLKVVPR